MYPNTYPFRHLEAYLVVENGEECRTIVSFAHKNNFDLIVIGSRGMGKVGEFFLGSTSNYVVHSSKIPVLIIK
jgi:nucleotide-binding universal stress UspA family protein